MVFAPEQAESSPQRTIYSVSKLNLAVRRLLEGHFGQVWLVGELSNFSAPASGHWYFTLKDSKAQVRCAMFRGANQRVMTQVGNGKQVMVRAKIGLYEPRGDYQLIVEHMEDAGAGLLQQQFEQLKAKLQSEGLFDPASKKALPTDIRRIGVVTSASGAALHDVLSVLKRRDASVEVIVYPSQVQGSQAAENLISALNTANRRNEVDVILLTRGGGSLEDLSCFNDETLARVVFTSKLPVISAVGHEVDFAITDFVADLRAPTPSAAAELLSQDRSHLRAQQQHLSQRLWRAWQHALHRVQHRQALLQQRLTPLHPAQQLQQQGQRQDELQRRLQQSVNALLHHCNQQQHHLQARLSQIKPDAHLERARQQHQRAEQQLQRAMLQVLKQAQQRTAANAHSLQLVSPLQTLSRGYSITQTDTGEVIKNAGQVEPGAVITTRLGQGELKSKVLD
ncbi:exodeoxyribonuclease VII large subunit [Aliidiomarina soli]|uniref:exodeoxyribonuclease VII large subunit n=1 Tax=Aliidiomarina soli TaxID=1928574 RepID=UPI003B849436